jgi:NDP-sugar pyrophosphorylase family protein
MLRPEDFFLLTDPIGAELFAGLTYVWEALPRLSGAVRRLVGDEQTVLGDVMPGAVLSDRPVYIGPGARVEPGAYVLGPAYIGPGAVVRHGALVRENVILLADSLLGHACEAKNSLFFPGAHASHFNYIGDSILGHSVNLGAGTKLSNLAISSRKDPETGRRPTIQMEIAGVRYDLGLAKLGAILGDGAQIGCNAVLNPGSLVGPRTLVYANVSLRKGYCPPDQIIKLRQAIEVVPFRAGL